MPAPRVFENGTPHLLEGTTTLRSIEGAAAAPPSEAVGSIAGSSTVAGATTAILQAVGAAAGTSTVAGVSDTAAPNVWNPADKNAGITLSNSDATATTASGSGYRGVRGLRVLDGTHHVIFAVGNCDANDFAIGIANLSASLSNWAGADNNSVAYYGAATVYRGGGSIGSVPSGNFSLGAAPELEIDAVAKTVRFRVGPSGTWSATFDLTPLGAGPYRLIWSTDSTTNDITITS